MLEEAAHTRLADPLGDGRAGHDRGAVLGRLFASAFWRMASLARCAMTIPHTPHDPGPGLWRHACLPCWSWLLVIGLFPMATAAWLVDAAASAVTGEAVTAKITHWHGLEAPALWMSLAAVGGGLMLLGAYPRLRRDVGRHPAARGEADLRWHDRSRLPRCPAPLTDGLHNGRCRGRWPWRCWRLRAHRSGPSRAATHAAGTRALLPVTPALTGVWAVLMLAALALPFFHRDRLVALVLTGVVGLLIAPMFALFLGPRPCPDADLGRGGDDHADAAGAELPAEDHAGGKPAHPRVWAMPRLRASRALGSAGWPMR